MALRFPRPFRVECGWWRDGSARVTSALVTGHARGGTFIHARVQKATMDIYTRYTAVCSATTVEMVYAYIMKYIICIIYGGEEVSPVIRTA